MVGFRRWKVGGSYCGSGKYCAAYNFCMTFTRAQTIYFTGNTLLVVVVVGIRAGGVGVGFNEVLGHSSNGL